MGRRKWTNRLTVEECRVYLSAGGHPYSGELFAGPVGSSWTVGLFKGSYGDLLGCIEYRITDSGRSGLAIHIPRQFARLDFRLTLLDAQTIPVTTVRPHLGGKRYWFLCGCGRRAARLYLPPGQRVFRCRDCYNLTYRSAQTHDQRVYKLARNPFAMGAAMHAEGLSGRLLAIRALVQFHKWNRKGRLEPADPEQAMEALLLKGELTDEDLGLRLVSRSR